MNRVDPKKLLLSKWTAVAPVAKQKHFVVVKLVEPETSELSGLPSAPVSMVEIEAVYSGAVQRLAWRELRDSTVWRQGWV